MAGLFVDTDSTSGHMKPRFCREANVQTPLCMAAILVVSDFSEELVIIQKRHLFAKKLHLISKSDILVSF